MTRRGKHVRLRVHHGRLVPHSNRKNIMPNDVVKHLNMIWHGHYKSRVNEALSIFCEYRCILEKNDCVIRMFDWYYLVFLFTPQPSGLEGYCHHGLGRRMATSRGGQASGYQTCGTRISVTAWRIVSVRRSVELSRPVVVCCHDHLPICPIWACPWAKNLSNMPHIGSRLCRTHISESAGWIYPI